MAHSESLRRQKSSSAPTTSVTSSRRATGSRTGWNAGRPRRIEDDLEGCSHRGTLLFSEPLALELDAPRALGESPTPEEYRARFPARAHSCSTSSSPRGLRDRRPRGPVIPSRTGLLQPRPWASGRDGHRDRFGFPGHARAGRDEGRFDGWENTSCWSRSAGGAWGWSSRPGTSGSTGWWRSRSCPPSGSPTPTRSPASGAR